MPPVGKTIFALQGEPDMLKVIGSPTPETVKQW
jgi:hypothetical protein